MKGGRAYWGAGGGREKGKKGGREDRRRARVKRLRCETVKTPKKASRG